MEPIHRVLKAGARRLLLNGWLRWATRVAAVLAAGLVLTLAAWKLTPLSVAWGPVFAATGGVWLLTSVLLAWRGRPRGLALADELDRRAGLRETLSTAMLVSQRPDGWSRAVVESARERASRVVLRDSVPIERPRGVWWPVGLAALFGAAAFLPRHDLTGLLEKKQAAAEEERELRVVTAQIEAKTKTLEEMLEKAGVEFAKEEPDEQAGAGNDANAARPKKAEDVRREALRKLTSVSDELTKLTEGQKGQQLQAMREQLRKLESPSEGPVAEFGRSLSRGNFADAKQALAKLEQKLKSEDLPESERKAAQEQLKTLSDQLAELSRQREDLAEKLQAAGLNAADAQKLAADPGQLEKALNQLQGMTPAEQQKLLEAAMAQSNAGEAMQAMAQAMAQMAQASDQSQAGQQGGDQTGQPSQSGQGGQQLAQQLSASEMLAAEVESAEMALAEASAQMQALGQGTGQGMAQGAGQPGEGEGAGQGQFLEGRSDQAGGGSGGPGQGQGEVGPGESPSDFILTKEKAAVQDQGGPIIASTVVYGAQIVGESKQAFGEAAAAAEVEAAEAIETMRVPREYHDAVRHYFGRLQRRAQGQSPAAAPAAPAATPAAETKPGGV